MSRRLLALLGFGSAAAQVVPGTGQKSNTRTAISTCANPDCVSVRISSKPKPANGECPVCGTVAAKPDPYLRGEIITRCAHCSAAFWRDAGGSK